MTVLTNPTPEIPRDRYGRPMVTPPDGGKPVAYTRCTTYIDVLEDKFNLQKWMQRNVALGLASRPDLLLSVSAHRDDKKTLDRICDDAREAASASAAATTGTAIHALTELIDRGQTLPVVPPNAKASLDAYAAATAGLTATHIEQFCVLDTLKIGGTPDRVVKHGNARYIADIKTGSIEWGALKIAMQLAIYSRSHTYDIATGDRGAHDADRTRGIIIHVPARDDPADAVASLHWVDLEAGWYAVQVAGQVRDKRKLKFTDLTEPFAPLPKHPAPGTVRGNTAMTRDRAVAVNAQAEQVIADTEPTLEARILACDTADAVRHLWTTHQDEWTEELTKAGAVRVAQLEQAS